MPEQGPSTCLLDSLVFSWNRGIQVPGVCSAVYDGLGEVMCGNIPQGDST